jgi:hypothetical protein
MPRHAPGGHFAGVIAKFAPVIGLSVHQGNIPGEVTGLD